MSEGEADAYAEAYLDLLDGLPQAAAAGRPSPSSTRPPGARCRASTCRSRSRRSTRRSIPSTSAAASTAVKERLRPIVRKAHADRRRAQRSTSSSSATATSPTRSSPSCSTKTEFRAYDEAGVVVQAYLRDAEADLRGLIDWARGARARDHRAPRQGRLLGLRDGARRPGGLAGAGVHAQARQRRDVRAPRAHHARAPAADPSGVRQPQRALAGAT